VEVVLRAPLAYPSLVPYDDLQAERTSEVVLGNCSMVLPLSLEAVHFHEKVAWVGWQGARFDGVVAAAGWAC